MSSRPFPLFLRFGAALLLICAFSAYCGAGVREPVSIVESLWELTDPLGSGWTVGDLDGDHETDIAVGQEVGQSDGGHLFRVELKLSHREASGSFTFANSDTLGVSITAVDVDGDHDLDLIINGRLSGQRIGEWINDGRGVFTQNLHDLYSPPDDRTLHSLRPDLPRQAIDEHASRRLPVCLPHARFVGAALLPVRAECGNETHCKWHFQKGLQYLRAPPTFLING